MNSVPHSKHAALPVRIPKMPLQFQPERASDSFCEGAYAGQLGIVVRKHEDVHLSVFPVHQQIEIRLPRDVQIDIVLQRVP